jgi:hypothetical protein
MSTATTAKATYTQLRDGSWGIRAAGKLSAGASVTVTKRDGTSKTETISKVLWTGTDSKSGQTVSLCSIARTASAFSYSGRRRYRNDDDQCTCPQCSSGSECLCIYGRG